MISQLERKNVFHLQIYHFPTIVCGGEKKIKDGPKHSLPNNSNSSVKKMGMTSLVQISALLVNVIRSVLLPLKCLLSQILYAKRKHCKKCPWLILMSIGFMVAAIAKLLQKQKGECQ